MENISIQASADIVGIDELFGYFLERIDEEYKEIEINAITTKRDLEAFIKLIEFLRDEAMITITDNAIKTIFIDPPNVSIIDLTLYAKENIKEEAIGKSFVVDIEKVKNFLKYLGKDDEINFKTLYSNRIMIKQDDMRYEIPLLDMEAQKPKIPFIEFKAGFELPIKKLRKVLKTLNNISDQIKIIATSSKITIEGYGYETESIKAEFKEDYLPIHMWDVNKAKSMFPIGYLIDLVDILHSFKVEKLTMWIANDMPCKISARVGNIDMNFWLAPRVEE